MYGLAGLRIGYLAGAESVVDIVRKTTVAYSVNTIAQSVALAALDDQAFIQATRTLVKEGQQMLAAQCADLKLPLLASDCNFAMIKLPFCDSLAYRLLMQQGIVVRPMTCFRFPGWIRVSISRRENMQEFCSALAQLVHSRAQQRPAEK
jgi:histidinol-phosphate aminotransferase